jgi:hypothetical protein
MKFDPSKIVQPNLVSQTKDRSAGCIPGLTKNIFFAMLGKRKDNL